MEFKATGRDRAAVAGTGWKLTLRTPSIGQDYLGGPITLRDSVALAYMRKRQARPSRGGDHGRIVAEGLGGTGAGRLRFRRGPSRLAMTCDNMHRRGEKRKM